jgi:ABC-2 type transport system ATP-binding protein
MTTNQPFLSVSKLQKTYPGADKPAVTDVSFDIHCGEIMALLGPNGAGKTTTVKMAAGLVLPTYGQIRIMGADVVRQRQQAVRHIGAVLEGARNLYWRLSARENLLYFGRLRGVSRRKLEQRINGLLEVLDLAEHQHKEVRQFSRGMQQKLAIAAALVHDPEVLLLDEPTQGLDVQSARKLEDIISFLAHDRGKAVLLTTHMMPLAEKLTDRIFVINHGKEVAFDATPALLQRFTGHRNLVEIETTRPLPNSFKADLQATYPAIYFNSKNGASTLTWPDARQSEILELLQHLDRRGVEIASYGRRQADLEEIFVALTSDEGTFESEDEPS